MNLLYFHYPVNLIDNTILQSGNFIMKMNKFFLTVFFFIFLTTNCIAKEAPQKVVDLAHNALVRYGKDPLIIAVVRGKNARSKPLTEIKKLDKIWKNTPGVADYMRELMDFECADYLKRIQKSKSYFAEIFLMNNQGTIVAMTDKTSDYWQGDEVGFQKSFNQGTGAVFVDEVNYDQSTRAELVQVSVPVMDGDKAIGAITFGIEVAAVE